MAAGVVSVPIPNDTYKLGFIGAGKMAESIARGVVKSGVLPASRIRTAHLGSSRRAAFESFGVKVFERNVEVVEDCDVIIFSVKPQIVKEVVLQLKPLFAEKLLVSVAAGVKLKDLQDECMTYLDDIIIFEEFNNGTCRGYVDFELRDGYWFTGYKEWAGHSRFIRVIPNTPAAVGEAASAMSLGGTATEEDGELIARLFGAIGKIWKTDEKLFDAITGLSGSGPAYIYLAIEALADGGVAAGLPRELALGLASQTENLVLTEVLKGHEFYTVWFDSGKAVSAHKIGILGNRLWWTWQEYYVCSKNHVLGAASMVSKGGKHPGQLKDDVASPGGTTIAGIHELEKGGFRGILMNAVVAATKRSQEFSKR